MPDKTLTTTQPSEAFVKAQELLRRKKLYKRIYEFAVNGVIAHLNEHRYVISYEESANDLLDFKSLITSLSTEFDKVEDLLSDTERANLYHI